MKYLFVLLFILPVFGQDFDMMQKHLDKQKMPQEITINGWTFSFYVATGEDTSGWECKQRYELMKEFYKIYREEYLRYVAKEMLDKEFATKIDTLFRPAIWYVPDSLSVKMW